MSSVLPHGKTNKIGKFIDDARYCGMGDMWRRVVSKLRKGDTDAAHIDSFYVLSIVHIWVAPSIAPYHVRNCAKKCIYSYWVLFYCHTYICVHVCIHRSINLFSKHGSPRVLFSLFAWRKIGSKIISFIYSTGKRRVREAKYILYILMILHMYCNEYIYSI